MLASQSPGNYSYIPSEGGRVPFCNAVVADAGYEIVRATLERPLPYRDGFQLIEQYLATLGRPRQALCGLELRCAEPYTRDGFNEFNRGYAALLQEWGLYADGVGSTARTNIAPALSAPTEQVLFAFSYAVPADGNVRRTFVISGAAAGGVRVGETSPEAVREQVAYATGAIEERLKELGLGWEDTTDIVVYAPQNVEQSLHTEVVPRIGSAVLYGIRWYPSRAPVIGTEIEVGAHGVRQEIRIPVA